MATKFNFNGQLIKLPGVYTQTKSGITNAPLNLSYGNVLVIDIDPSSEFGGGAGINGEISQENDSIYSFDSLRAFRSFVRGGKYWDLAAPLFRPFGAGTNGISTLRYIRALTTTSASRVITITDGGNGGSYTVRTRHEGLAGNGAIAGETPGSNSFTVDTLGSTGQELIISVNAIQVGSYTQDAGDAAVADIADGIVAAINTNTPTHGWIADNTVSSDTVVLTKIPGFGDSVNGQVIADSGTYAGSITVNGTIAGGVDGTNLSQGLGFLIETSQADSTKFVLKFYRGTYTGLDSNDSLPYDGIAAASAAPELIATSDDFNTYQELLDWMNADFDFNNNFELVTSAISGTGVINSAAIAPYSEMSVLAAGSQSFSASDLTTVLNTIAELDYTFVLAPDGGSNYSSVSNASILDHISSDARFEKFMVVYGGDDKNTFESESVTAADFFDSDKVIVVHGAPQVASNVSGTGLRTKSAEYKTANVLGRICGLEPQTPVTFKGLAYEKEVHALTKLEKERALDKGVLATAFDGDIGAFVVVQGVNTLQRNSFLVNEDGTSFSVQLKRIAAQLNKEIEVNAKQQLLGNQAQGPNRSTLSPEVVTEWLKGYLQRRTATSTVDNLILSFQDINVEVNQDAYEISYAFVPNFEINKLFFTGLIIDPSI